MKKPTGRPLLLFAAILCCAQGLRAQEPCRLERAVAPDYGGVMLGMSVEELARMFPGSEELRKGPDAATDAAKPFVVSLGMLELGVRREEFGNVGELVLTFLKGRVHRIDVRFRQPVWWKDAVEFSEDASRRLAVPADSWGETASDALKQSRVLDCRGFSVVVRIDKGGPSTLSIVDTDAGKGADTNAGKTDASKAPLPKPSPPRPSAPRRKGKPSATTRTSRNRER